MIKLQVISSIKCLELEMNAIYWIKCIFHEIFSQIKHLIWFLSYQINGLDCGHYRSLVEVKRSSHYKTSVNRILFIWYIKYSSVLLIFNFDFSLSLSFSNYETLLSQHNLLDEGIERNILSIAFKSTGIKPFSGLWVHCFAINHISDRFTSSDKRTSMYHYIVAKLT